MGRAVVCSCGQRNDIEGFRYGEAVQCLACGQLLPLANEAYKAEEFELAAPDLERGFGTENPFESPSPQVDASVPPPTERAWEGRVREGMGTSEDNARCARCARAFRGAWDIHRKPEGLLCHICASQADKDYVVPEASLRRELYRPEPPRKIHRAPDPGLDEAARKKRKEIMAFSAVAVVTLAAALIFPVEDWIAAIFSADLGKAPDLPVAWFWVARGVHLLVSALGQGLTLYLALAWSRLLYEGGIAENWPALTYLAVVFTILNELVMLAATYFVVMGPVGGLLVGMAATVALIIKLLMISERYTLQLEGCVSFFMSWVLSGFLLWPCTFAVHQLLQGIVSALAL